MSNKKYEYDAIIKKPEKVNSGYVEFPYDVKKEFGKGRVKVKALLDGYLYKGSLVNMGNAFHWLGINQEVRRAIGKNPGDIVHVIIEEDTEERIVDIPDDFGELMQREQGVWDYFNKLSFTHKKEYVRWILEAKKEDTRRNRLIKAIEMLKNGSKTPD